MSNVNNKDIKNYLNYKLDPYDKVPNIILNKINKNGEKQYPYGTLNKNVISKVKGDIRRDIQRDVAKRNKRSLMNDLIQSHKGDVEEEKAHEIVKEEKEKAKEKAKEEDKTTVKLFKKQEYSEKKLNDNIQSHYLKQGDERYLKSQLQKTAAPTKNIPQTVLKNMPLTELQEMATSKGINIKTKNDNDVTRYELIKKN